MGWLDKIKGWVNGVVEKWKQRQAEIKENKSILRRFSHKQLKKIAKMYGISTKGTVTEVKYKKEYNPVLQGYMEKPIFYTKEVELDYEELVDRLAKKLTKEQMEEVKRRLGIFKPIIKEEKPEPEREGKEYEIAAKISIIDKLIVEVQRYYPTRPAKKEETYEEGLYQWLLARFGFTKTEVVRQYYSYDIAIPKAGVVIEVKHRMNKSDRDRLIGQIIDGKERGYYVIVAIYNTKNKRILHEMVNRLSKLNIKGLAVIDDGKLIYRS